MTKLIVANWKMNLSYQASLDLARKFSRAQKIKTSDQEIVVCPDYLSLPAVAAIFKKTRLQLGAQDAAVAARGPYTGEVSPWDLKKLGVKYVLVGHSERRELREDSLLLAAKIRGVLKERLIPLIFLGEQLIDRENGETRRYLNQELRRLLTGVTIKHSAALVLVYEPVWAISTAVKGGRPLAASEINSWHQYIKTRAAKILHKNVRVLYGGSVDPVSGPALLLQPNVSGLVVGAASLKLASFSTIC